MGGKSDQEKASENLYSDISNINPEVNNRFNNFVYPYSGKQRENAFNKATDKSVKTLKQINQENTAKSGQAAASNYQSRGLGGSILQDAIAKARAKESAGGTSAITKLMTNRLNQLPGLMSTGNKEAFNLTGAQQNVDLQNLMNMFSKFGAQQGAIGGLDSGTWFDDLLATVNTGANVAKAFI